MIVSISKKSMFIFLPNSLFVLTLLYPTPITIKPNLAASASRLGTGCSLNFAGCSASPHYSTYAELTHSIMYTTYMVTNNLLGRRRKYGKFRFTTLYTDVVCLVIFVVCGCPPTPATAYKR